MYARIWQAVARCEMGFERTDKLRSFQTFRRLKTIPQIITFVKDSGAEATIQRAGLSGFDSGSCITDHILERHILDIKSVQELEALLQSEGVSKHPVVGMQCFKNNVRHLGNVFMGGRDIDPDSHVIAARFARVMKIFDPDCFNYDLKKGRNLRQMAQNIFDLAEDREEAIKTFTKYGLDLYKIAGEPYPLFA